MKHIRFLPILFAVIATTPFALAQDDGNPRDIQAGTRFLTALDGTLSTKDLKAGDHFEARTLEPLVTAMGAALAAGTQIRGHVDKVEQARKTGRARLWLTFDDVRTGRGWGPIVTVVDDVPGVHSIHVDNRREGEIETQSAKGHDEMAAIAAGAFVGAAAGVAARNKKGAAVGAATAFMTVSGLGQELTLSKDTKLELTLERDLPIAVY